MEPKLTRITAATVLGVVSVTLVLPLLYAYCDALLYIASLLNGNWIPKPSFLLTLFAPPLAFYIMWKLYRLEMYIIATLVAIAIYYANERLLSYLLR